MNKSTHIAVMLALNDTFHGTETSWARSEDTPRWRLSIGPGMLAPPFCRQTSTPS